ncbi:MAG TPA: LytTR family DNA-binding domain-containing protein [Chitinophagaceae bacterium]
MNCIAVDDEPLALKLLEDNISKVPYLKLVAQCGDAFEATKALQENAVDLMFIDIQMPGLSGLQFVKSLAQKPIIIFLTAYKQYALDAFDLDVVDYLVKPVPLDRFMKACNKAKELFDLRNSKKQNENVPAPDYFFQHVDYSMVKIMFNDIEWIEGLRDYIKIHLKSSNKPLVIRSTFKTIEADLPPSKFIRIHKSYIVSLDSITSVRKTSVFIKDLELPVGETYRDVIEKLVSK